MSSPIQKLYAVFALISIIASLGALIGIMSISNYLPNPFPIGVYIPVAIFFTSFLMGIVMFILDPSSHKKYEEERKS